MTSHPPSRSSSGARIAGDRYQHMVAWTSVLDSLKPTRRGREVGVEVDDAGSLDDVVVKRDGAPATYTQVKFANDMSSPLSTEWLLSTKGPGSRSILQKLFASWKDLRVGNAEADVRLLTNRSRDPNDSLLALVDGVTSKLVPRALNVGEHSAGATILKHWCEHLNVEREELLAFLACFTIQSGHDWPVETERARNSMLSRGLRDDDSALAVGLDFIQQWIISGDRYRTCDQLELLVSGLRLDLGQRSATLVVQAIDHVPHPEDAEAVLDWVHLFDGQTPYDRVRPHDPASWMGTMAPDLRRAASVIRSSTEARVFVRGAMRLPTWFTIGAEFRHVTGMEVCCRQGGQVWASDVAATPIDPVVVRTTDIGGGADLVVAVGISADPTTEVLEFVGKHLTSVGRVLTLLPPTPHDRSVRDAGSAVALARAIRGSVRSAVAEVHAPRLHLFLACPAGLALLLGHRWNRMTTTLVYEHLKLGAGYMPTFEVSA